MTRDLEKALCIRSYRLTLNDNLDVAAEPEPELIRLCLFLATSAVTPLDGLGFVEEPLEVGTALGFGFCEVCLEMLTADSFRTKMP